MADVKYQYAHDIRFNLIEHLKDEPCVQENKQLHEELREEMRKVRRGQVISSKKVSHDESNGILTKVPGYEEAVSQLPPPAIAEERPCIVEVQANKTGHTGWRDREQRAFL
ncbi:hypothetical protein CSC67_07710 [Pusillimonas caeni]|uniref:hypothetical protein n=1 Tax=Pusillimonas caeni TaxID=1348472 RepID=UPI00107577B4|nr:hypothetical protein [Pusillimonas caeni]TFL14047.1 hypothetical protein CSC67_07710 [Pusillimonas caeni]